MAMAPSEALGFNEMAAYNFPGRGVWYILNTVDLNGAR